ncbi:MAG: DUF4190 domain-containing protein [Lachnospiraceae bacterium]|nr:DUF4190 domain-containing protein [Lachnospiraceae bacterium]
MENQNNSGNGLAIAALILGIVSIAFSWSGFVGLLAVAALVLGIIARKKTEGSKRTMATVGMILGIVGIVFNIVGIICVVVMGVGLAELGYW